MSKADLYPWLPARWLVRLRYDTRAALAAGAGRPYPDDEIIPFRHAEILFEAATEPKVLLQLAGGHNDGFIFMREAWSMFWPTSLSGIA